MPGTDTSGTHAGSHADPGTGSYADSGTHAETEYTGTRSHADTGNLLRWKGLH